MIGSERGNLHSLPCVFAVTTMQGLDAHMSPPVLLSKATIGGSFFLPHLEWVVLSGTNDRPIPLRYDRVYMVLAAASALTYESAMEG